MKESNIRSMIYSGFKTDKRDSGHWSYQMEIFLLTLKSLVPNLELGGNRIDYKRFEKELELWKSYRHGGNRAILDVLKDSFDNYWINEDESIGIRVFAITVANENIEAVKEEVLKSISYTTGEAGQLIDGLFLSLVLFSLFSGYSKEEASSNAKEEIIRFSIKEELLEKDYFRIPLENKGKYIVDFERRRIELLNRLNKDKEDSILNEKFEYKLSSFLESIEAEDVEIKDKFSENISRYIWRMRKGWLSPQQIEIKSYIEPDIFKLKKGEESFHSLLNKVKLISIEQKDDFEIRYVSTKSGKYRFFKRKNGS